MRPVILQSESAECGLACLAIVADHFGLGTSMLELRRRFPVSLRGAKLSQLVEIAQKIGFSARAVKIELEDLSKLGTPCILHWNMKHFVVLKRAGKRGVVVLDPAVGEKRLTYSQVSEHFTGVALQLEPVARFGRPTPTPQVRIRELTGQVRGLGAGVAQVLLISVALQVFVLISPLFIQWVVDQVLVSADRELLLVLAAGFGLVMLLQVVIGVLRGYVVVYLSTRLGLQWTMNVFSHVLKLPLDFFEKRHLGDITSRMSSVQQIQQTLTNSFVEAVVDGLMAVVTLSVMLLYSWKLALVTLFATAIYFLIRYLAYRPMRDRTEGHLRATAEQQSHLLESLRGMQSVKVAGRESQRHSVYFGLSENAAVQEARLAKMEVAFAGASNAVFGLERVLVIWIGALIALSGLFSAGMLIAYLAYKEQFSQRMAGLIDKWVQFRMLRLHGERLADIVLTEPERHTESCEVELPTTGRIEFRNVSFRYGIGDSWVLRDCSFVVEPGESVAIVGPSGCGKTTLTKLLLGLLEPDEGCICLGGHDIREIGAQNVRRKFGAVMQDDQLFAGTIAENISFFDSESDQERVEHVAAVAEVHQDILSMPMGYHSMIGDMGSALSGGQRQRLLLARALYRRPEVLVLDEATSHLDVERESLVNEAVSRMKLTKIIVAHRPQTIASADRVLEIRGGRAVPASVARPARPAEPANKVLQGW
ncbi:peptidase domain-containing ABC transporter [Luteimonas sp. SDU101]|uniref:peptidase domain-containing ABC transporter n=1 Tax=unclassified Luteimonas TaxID=2629088 RepID=UPI003EB7CF52